MTSGGNENEPATAALVARPMTVADLTREHFGLRVTCERGTGWLYGIHDDFNDGYPDRTLIVVTSEFGDDATWQFTDSDPTGYPKTMSTPVEVSDV